MDAEFDDLPDNQASTDGAQPSSSPASLLAGLPLGSPEFEAALARMPNGDNGDSDSSNEAAPEAAHDDVSSDHPSDDPSDPSDPSDDDDDAMRTRLRDVEKYTISIYREAKTAGSPISMVEAARRAEIAVHGDTPAADDAAADDAAPATTTPPAQETLADKLARINASLEEWDVETARKMLSEIDVQPKPAAAVARDYAAEAVELYPVFAKSNPLAAQAIAEADRLDEQWQKEGSPLLKREDYVLHLAAAVSARLASAAKPTQIPARNTATPAARPSGTGFMAVSPTLVREGRPAPLPPMPKFGPDMDEWLNKLP